MRRVSACIGVLAALVIMSPALAVSRVTAGHDGWWSTTPAGPPVPPTGLAVAASGGEPSRIAAIGVGLFLDPGATLERLELTLVEHGDAGSNLNVATPPGAPAPLPATPVTAAVVACPATTPVVPARNGPAAAAPKYDCELAKAEGARGSNGTWVFDLTSIAKLWLGSLAPNGVVLVEAVTAPGSFQVTYRDVASGGVRLGLTVTEAEQGEPPTESFTSFDGGGSSEEGFGPLPFDDPRLGDAGFTDPPPLDAPAEPPAAATAAPRRSVAAAGPGPAAGRVSGNLPALTVLLVPIVLLAVAALGYVLGPAGDPAVTGTRRSGAVTRALAGRAATTPTETP